MSTANDQTPERQAEIRGLETLIHALRSIQRTPDAEDSRICRIAKTYADCLEVQSVTGTWNVEDYLHGMLNGMILMAYFFAKEMSGTLPLDVAPFWTKPVDTNSWEANAQVLLNSYPGSVRSREGGGKEDLKASLVLTFTGLVHDLARARKELEDSAKPL